MLFFSLFLSANYFGLWNKLFDEFDLVLSYRAEIPIYLTTFQYWLFDISGILFESIFLAFIVALFSYHYRDYKVYQYLIFGFIIRYFFVVFWLVIYNQSIYSIMLEFKEIAELRMYILVFIQAVFTIFASYVGYSYGVKQGYYDENDYELGYIAGISKKTWVLLIISINPAIQVLTKYTIVALYRFSIHLVSLSILDFLPFVEIVAETQSVEHVPENGLWEILSPLLSIPIAWMIGGALFLYGKNAIGNKNSNLRYLKILVIFVVIPILLVAIPVSRNRTWLY